MAHMQSKDDSTNEEELQKSALPSKKLKTSANKASLKCVKKRKAVNKEVECECKCECYAVHDEGDVLSEQSCQQVIPKNKTRSRIESDNLQRPVESLKSWDYFDSEPIVPVVGAQRLVTVRQFTFDPIRLRRELAKMIVLHEYPLSVVDHIGFRDFSRNLNPSFGMVSQNTIENDIMKIFEFERSNARIQLSQNSPSRVAITTKMWSSSEGKRFLAITGHVIDHTWQRQPYIMRFANVPSICKNESICKVILDCLSNFNVEKKLSTITVDSHTSDDELIDILAGKLSVNERPFRGKLFRLPCFARTLSLMVQHGFDVVRHVIEKVRDSIVFWTTSPERETTFEKAARKLGVSTPAAKLALDHGSSWSSTFLMLQDSLGLKDVFSHLGQHESRYDSSPSNEEWDLATEVCNRLKILYDQTKNLVDCPAACMYFMHVCEIKVNLSEWLDSEVPEIKEMASKMVENFDKYWLAARDILGVATVFHPKYRFFPLKYYFPKIYGSEAETEADKIHRIFYGLFREYKSSLANDEAASGEELRSQLSRPNYEFMLYLRELEKEEPEMHEVDLYLKGYSGRETEDSDILSWWEGSRSRYRVLHKMAQDILAIPIFAVDAEDAFGVGGKVLGANRSRLHPTMVEALMCTQRWVRSHKRSELDSKVSSKARKHSLGTIHDDAEVERGIIFKAKSSEQVHLSE